MCTRPRWAAASHVFAVWNLITISQMRRRLVLKRLRAGRGAAGAAGHREVTENYELHGQNTSVLSDWLAGSHWKPSERSSGMFGLCFPDGQKANNFHKRRWSRPAVVKLLVLSFFTQPGSFLHLSSLARSHTSHTSVAFFALALTFPSSGQVWRVSQDLLSLSREDPGQLWSAWVFFFFFHLRVEWFALDGWRSADGASACVSDRRRRETR